VYSIESLTPDTTQNDPCGYCATYPIVAKDSTVISITDIAYDISGKVTVVPKSIFEDKLEINTYPKMIDFCPLLECSNLPTNLEVSADGI
jgi:hypothetical protein